LESATLAGIPCSESEHGRHGHQGEPDAVLPSVSALDEEKNVSSFFPERRWSATDKPRIAS
jgi:hypothetical protein